jgi:DNA polymerase-3 subunit epsilon
MEIKNISDFDYIVSGISIRDIEKQRFCVFDFESTGINHETEYITQIGAIIIENNCIQETKTFNSYIKSPKPITEEVEQFTGIYNTYLDLPLLRNECKRNNLSMILNPCLDTKALFSYLHPEIKDIIWTDYLIKYYNIYDKDLKIHDALGDSILIGRIFLRIVEELEARDIKDIEFIDPVVVKRFLIRPLV